MAALLNDRNELLFSAASRVTGASVSVSSGAATSLIVPKSATAPVPAAITLTATVTGYVTPAYVWSYRFGDTGAFTALTPTTNPITVTCDAAFLTAAGTSTLVQYRVQVTETASNLGVNGSEVTLSIPILREGINGVDAINSVQVTLYRRSATNTAPAVITTGNSTYTFSNAQVVGQPTDWTQAIPAASNGAYLWVIRVLAASVGTNYQFANTLWSAPVLFTQDGVNGTNTALLYAYQRSATALTTNPGAVDYSFSTNQITTATLANSWLKTIPAGTDPLYVTLATAVSSGTTDNVLATEWTTPVLLVQNGINTATIYLYARNSNSSTAPALATTGSATYTFGTGALSGTIPTNWTQALPAESGGSVIWIVQATAASAGATDTIANTEWGTPRVLAQIGANGTPGTRGSRQLYSNNAAHTSTYTLAPNDAGAASYAVRATQLIATATTGTIPTTPIEGDTVTFTNGDNYVYTITYNSSTTAWVTPGTVIDGSLLVTGSVTAAKINSNGLTIRDTAGNVILSAGASLAASSLNLPGYANSAISINANGSLTGAGGGAVTIGGLGYTGALNATFGKSLGLPLTSWVLNGQSLVTLIDGKVGTSALRLSGIGGAYPRQGNYIAIDPAKTYRTRFWARPSSNAAGLLYFSLHQFLNTSGTEGPSNGGRDPYKPSGISRATHIATYGNTWGEYSFTWTANDWQAGVKFVEPEFLDNYAGAVGHWDVQDFTFEEVTEIVAAQTTANTAISTANNAAVDAGFALTAAGDRISKSQNSILAATISVNAVSGAGFRAGNLTWDANGARTGGSGVAMTPGGLLGVNSSGTTTFSINATTGDATFSGVAQSSDGLFKIDFANKSISISV